MTDNVTVVEPVINQVVVASPGPQGPTGPGAGWIPSDNGLLACSMADPASANATTAPASGFLFLARIKVPAGAGNITNIVHWVFAAGSGLTAGQNWLALFDSSGTRVGLSSDMTTAWATAGQKSASLNAAITPNAAGETFYAAMLANGTTRPTVAISTSVSGASTPANIGITSAPYRAGYANTGITTIPASITLSAMNAGGAFHLMGLT